jgi:hypothetical protein
MDSLIVGGNHTAAVKMSLLRFVYHTPVGSPTYLDLLPVDVLRHALIPFLGWEDRIHINRMTPPGDRTPPNKIPKDRIAAHQLHMSISATTRKIKDWDAASRTRGLSQQRKIDALLDVLRILNKGHNMIVSQYSLRLRDTIGQKMVEFSDPVNLRKIRLLAQRHELQVAVQVILERMTAIPYSHDLKPKKWLRERVTQNETSLMYAEDREGGVRIFRRQGDIYTQWE